VSKPLFCLGEAWGENEAKIRRPFVGASGVELLRMLAESGNITLTTADHEYMRRFWEKGDPEMLECVWQLHPEIYRSNVFQQRPPGNKLEWFCGPRAYGMPGYPPLIGAKCVRAEFRHELERLQDELLRIDPNLVICLGNAALWAMSGKVGISKLRGTTLSSTHTATGYKLLGTYHPAAILRQWELRPIGVMDLCKAARERGFPEIRRTRREIWIEPTLADLDAFYELHIRGRRYLSIDIENPGGPISEVGLGHSTAALVVPIIDDRKRDRSYWRSAADEVCAVRFIKRVAEDPSTIKVMQNGLHDISVLYRHWGIKTANFDEDCMLLHHAMQPESLKGLGFLGAAYIDEMAWKEMRKFKSLKRDD